MTIQCAVQSPQCKKEGRNSFEIYSETLNKEVIIILCDDHLAQYKKAGAHPKFHNHPEIKWQTTMDKNKITQKIEIPEEKEEKEIKIRRK